MAAFTTIDDAGAFYSTLIYTGNDVADRAITGAGFQPDWVVMKNIDSAYNWETYDAVRGVEENINWNQNYAEATHTYGVKTFDSDGFTIGTVNDATNGDTIDYVNYNWKAGTTTGIDTTGSTITPAGYSFNQDAGMSIIKYTGNDTSGALVPHGLGAEMQCMVLKDLTATEEWRFYHQNLDTSAPEDYYLQWNSDSARGTSTTIWNDTVPTTVNFSLGSSNSVNDSGKSFIVYCFRGIQGFSKFGQYTGNGDTDGTFVYTGFRPALIITRDYANVESWGVYDNKRIGYNYNNWFLNTNGDRAEGESVYPDILSNGFKWRHGDGMINGSGKAYVYMAFAESPFCNSNGVPTNAR